MTGIPAAHTPLPHAVGQAAQATGAQAILHAGHNPPPSPTSQSNHGMDISPVSARSARSGQSLDYESPLQSPSRASRYTQSPGRLSTISSNIRMSEGRASPAMPSVTAGVNAMSLQPSSPESASHRSDRMALDSHSTPSSGRMATSDDFPRTGGFVAVSPPNTPSSRRMATSEDFHRSGGSVAASAVSRGSSGMLVDSPTRDGARSHTAQIGHSYWTNNQIRAPHFSGGTTGASMHWTHQPTGTQ